MDLMRKLCERISKHFLKREIWDREGGTIYLSRFYVLGGPRDLEHVRSGEERRPGGKWDGWTTLPFNIMLHKFHRSDDDGALHNHPWKWSVSLILAGGYSEERRHLTEKMCDMHGRPHAVWRVKRRLVTPFSLNVIRADDYHRVDLLEKDCWSLFIAGPKAQSWGFWDRVTNKITPWREFIARRRNIEPDEVAVTYQAGSNSKVYRL